MKKRSFDDREHLRVTWSKEIAGLKKKVKNNDYDTKIVISHMSVEY